MTEETFKICVRAYFPDAEFAKLPGGNGYPVVEVMVDGEWFHTIHWEDGKARKFGYEYMGEKKLLGYLKQVNKTKQMYDRSRIVLPLDAYGSRHIAMMHFIMRRGRE